MKKLISLMMITYAFTIPSAYAGKQDCGYVTIDQMLTGGRHGGMMHVTNTSCGPQSGWICLDPKSEVLHPRVSAQLYVMAFQFYILKKSFSLNVYDDKYPSACGGYPAVEDMRG